MGLMLKLSNFLLAWWAASRRSFSCVNFNFNQEIQPVKQQRTREYSVFKNGFCAFLLLPNVRVKRYSETFSRRDGARL